ncbi:MAG: T9SS type A sorting domain-containing protein [Bacteroidetes bacterium]|nr:T9SS type A sorting domain-containing protein [Bacteroidota bacterium]
MKKLILLLIALPLFSFSQIQNGNFEDLTGWNLSYWQSTCGANPAMGAPTGGGDWSIQVMGGNLQGCFPGYAYQVLPTITNGQSFTLTGWVKADQALPVGIFFGTTNNGVLTSLAGDTTSSSTWTQLTIQSTYNLNPGDTVVVLLFGGIVTGPLAVFGSFDLIELTPLNGIADLENELAFTVYPNPISDQTTLKFQSVLSNASLSIFDSYGKLVKQIIGISGREFKLNPGGFEDGAYFLRVVDEGGLVLCRRIVISDK